MSAVDLTDVIDATPYEVCFAGCACGCGSSGYLVHSKFGWHASRVVHRDAAELAACLLNDGRVTEDEIDVLWGVDTDYNALERFISVEH